MSAFVMYNDFMKKLLKRIFFGPQKRRYTKRIVVKPTVALGLPKTEFKKRKKEFQKKAEERVEFFAQQYGFKYGRVSVRNQKTR